MPPISFGLRSTVFPVFVDALNGLIVGIIARQLTRPRVNKRTHLPDQRQRILQRQSRF